MIPVKCVVVGDGNVGKTSMLMAFTSDKFPTDYIPTVFDNYSINIVTKSTQVCLTLWDTAGQEDYDRLRPLSYPKTDIFLLAFSVVSVTSFKNIKVKWYPEVKFYCPETPYVLIGTKSDLRGDHSSSANLIDYNLKIVQKDMAQKMLEKIEANGYAECSALNRQGLKDVFDLTINIALKSKDLSQTQKPKAKSCVLL